MFYFSEDNEDNINTIDLFLKITLGNDTRFTLDDRFTENNCQTEESEVVKDTDECNLQKEKEKQLDILESILGTPLTVKSQGTKSAK